MVHNASFEQYNQCPQYYDQIRFADYWNGIDTTNTLALCLPEYCNICSPSIGNCHIPNNGKFYQYPRTGNGMVQVRMLVDTASQLDVRDYLQGRLYKQLEIGKTYCVSFYVNLTEFSAFAIDHIGAYLDNGSIDIGQDSVGCALPQTAIVPQVVSTTIINDTLRWVKIQGSFIANGTEKFITIGNFSDFAHTNIIAVSGWSPDITFYLVDDVSVIETTEVVHAGPDMGVAAGDSVHIGTSEEGMPCTWYVAGDTTPVGYSGGIWVKPDTTTTYVVEMDLCGHVTRDTMTVTVWPVGTKPLTPKGELDIWPNPVKDELHISNAAGGVFSVYNLIGKEVYKQVISSENEIMNTESLQKGIYVVHIADPVTGFRVMRKIVKD